MNPIVLVVALVVALIAGIVFHIKRPDVPQEVKDNEWRRRQKSPFVAHEVATTVDARQDLSYLYGCITVSPYASRSMHRSALTSINSVIYDEQSAYNWACRYGAQYLANMDGWYYFQQNREPKYNFEGKLIGYKSGHNNMIAYLEDMPDHPHLVPVYAKAVSGKPVKAAEVGDVVCLRGGNGYYFAKIIKIRNGFNASWIFEPLFSTPQNPMGWICKEEYRHSVEHGTPPVPGPRGPAY